MALPKKGYKPGIYRFVSGTVDGNGDFSITNIPKDGYVSGIYQLTEVTIDADGNTSVAEDDIGITAAIEVTVDGSGDLSVTEVPEEGYVSGVYRVTTSTNIPKEGFNQIDFSAVIGTISGGKWETGPGIQFNAPLTNSLIPSSAVAATYTFARGDTDATVTDFEGLVKDVTANEARFPGARRVKNECAASEDFTDAIWGLGGATTLTDQPSELNPLGATGGVARLQLQATSGSYFTSPATGGTTYTLSFWVKDAGAGSPDFALRIGPGTLRITSTGVWTRYSYTAAAGTFGITNGDDSYASDVYIWGCQVDLVDGQANQNPSEYVSNGLGSDHGSNQDGVKYFNTQNGNTVASGVVTESTGAAIADATLQGVLIEGTRTNYCLHSADLSNAAWVASNITKSSDGVDLPDGLSGTAETLTASAGNGTLLQSITLASAVNTFSVYLQRKTGTGNIDITLDNGVTWTTKALTGVGTWDRVDFTGAFAANPVVGIRIVTSGDAVQMWGAQLETGTFLSSHIPTTSAAATRNDESLSYPNTNILDDEGTLACSFTPNGSSADYGNFARALVGVRGVGTDLLHIDISAGEFVVADGTSTTTSGAMPSLVSDTTVKLAARWSATTSLMDIGQDTVEDQVAFDGSMNKSTAMRIGYSGSKRASGTCKNLIVYNGSVSDSVFAGLTA